MRRNIVLKVTVSGLRLGPSSQLARLENAVRKTFDDVKQQCKWEDGELYRCSFPMELSHPVLGKKIYVRIDGVPKKLRAMVSPFLAPAIGKVVYDLVQEMYATRVYVEPFEVRLECFDDDGVMCAPWSSDWISDARKIA